MQNIEETNLRDFTVRYTNSQEYHAIKNEIFNTDAYYLELENDSPIIVDCGAHIGISMLYYKYNFPNSIIYAYEPNPISFQVLQENIVINGLSNVEAIDKAVDITDTRKVIHIDNNGGWYSTASYTSGTWKGTEKTVPVTIQTVDFRNEIDRIIKTHQNIDLLKIDIEGYEFKILVHIQSKLINVSNLIIEYHPSLKKQFGKIKNIVQGKYKEIVYIQEGKDVKSPDLNQLFIIRATR